MDCARDGFSATMSTVFIPAPGSQGPKTVKKLSSNSSAAPHNCQG